MKTKERAIRVCVLEILKMCATLIVASKCVHSERKKRTHEHPNYCDEFRLREICICFRSHILIFQITWKQSKPINLFDIHMTKNAVECACAFVCGCWLSGWLLRLLAYLFVCSLTHLAVLNSICARERTQNWVSWALARANAYSYIQNRDLSSGCKCSRPNRRRCMGIVQL